MYIHLGGNQILRVREVVAILDISSTDPHPLIETMKKSGGLIEISTDDVKSYVVTRDHVYSSPISSVTLMKRAEQMEQRTKAKSF